MSSGVDMGGPVTAMATVADTAGVGVGEGGAAVGLGEGEGKGLGEGEGLVMTNVGVGEICRAVGVALGTPTSSRGPVIKTAAFRARRMNIPTPIAAASPLFTRETTSNEPAGRPSVPRQITSLSFSGSANHEQERWGSGRILPGAPENEKLVPPVFVQIGHRVTDDVQVIVDSSVLVGRVQLRIGPADADRR